MNSDRPQADLAGGLDLVSHQGQQWPDKQRRSGPTVTQNFRRDKVDNALAPAGALHYEHALSEHGRRFNRFPLSLAKQLIRTQHLAQKRFSFGFIHEASNHLWEDDEFNQAGVRCAGC